MQDKVAKSRKRPVNLSIDAVLAAEAKAAGTNLSALLERARASRRGTPLVRRAAAPSST